MTLFLGFLASLLFATSAMAECQDGRCRIVSIDYELGTPDFVNGELKFSLTNLDPFKLSGLSGLLVPDSFHIKDISNPPGNAGFKRRIIMLNIAYSEPVGLEESVS